MKSEKTSKPVVFAHGGIAAIALVLLILYYIDNPAGLLVPLILFIAAALGGFFLFFRDINKKEIPKSLAFIHAGAAVTAFIFLLLIVL